MKKEVYVEGLAKEDEKIMNGFLKWLKERGLASLDATGFSIRREKGKTVVIPRW